MKALKWPFKAQETRKISAELRGFSQTFHFALTVDGCQLLLKTSDEVTHTLKSSLHSTAITEQNSKNIILVLETLSSLPQTTRAIEQAVQKLEEKAKIEDDKTILDWLGGPYLSNMHNKHQTIKKSRSPNTGQWIFRDLSYKRWKSGALPVLWGQGKPGAGKSVLMSHIVDKLKDDATRDKGVAFFYCEYSQASGTQTPEAILASFSYQLLVQLKSIPQELMNTYQRHRRSSTRPDLTENMEILQKICTRFSKVWLLVDAFDELDPECGDDLIGVIETMMISARIMITSRPQSVDSENLEANTLRCTISAPSEDLTTVIRKRLGKAAIASRRLRESLGWEAFVNDTVEKLVKIADGMFLLVSLQLEMLLRPRTVIEMREVLESISEKLLDFYKLTLDRIRARETDTALKILAWLVKLFRPMSSGELQEALAVEYSATYINSDALIHQDDMLDMCCGLVTVDAKGTLSLAHATVPDFLAVVSGFDHTIAKVCLDYLTFETFASQTRYDYVPDLANGDKEYGGVGPAMEAENAARVRFEPEPELEVAPWLQRGAMDVANVDTHYRDRVHQHPFLPYAATYWPDHLERAQEPDEMLDIAMSLLKGQNAPAMLQAWGNNKTINFDGITPLHIAALFGSLSLTQLLITQAEQKAKLSESPKLYLEMIVDARVFGNTPLLFAVHHKHDAVAKLLLKTGVVNPSIEDNTIIRWTLEWGNLELLQLMVTMPKFNIELACRQFGKEIEKCFDNFTDIQNTEDASRSTSGPPNDQHPGVDGEGPPASPLRAPNRSEAADDDLLTSLSFPQQETHPLPSQQKLAFKNTPWLQWPVEAAGADFVPPK